MVDETRIAPTIFQRNTETPEKAAMLPGLTTDYKAAGTAESEVSRLVLVMGKDGFKIGNSAYIAFQYVHIGTGEFGFTANGQFFRFVFSDIQPKLVTAHGRNLLRIFDNISQRRVPWIRVKDRDFRAEDDAADNEPIITLLEVKDWVRPKAQTAALTEAMAVHSD